MVRYGVLNVQRVLSLRWSWQCGTAVPLPANRLISQYEMSKHLCDRLDYSWLRCDDKCTHLPRAVRLAGSTAGVAGAASGYGVPGGSGACLWQALPRCLGCRHGAGAGGYGVVDGPDADRLGLVPTAGGHAGEAAALLRPPVFLVEVDATCYALPAAAAAQVWAARAPAGFTFNVKAFSLLTGHPAPVAALPADLRPAAEETGKDRVYY
jgi:Protein of unknown function DUF72